MSVSLQLRLVGALNVLLGVIGVIASLGILLNVWSGLFSSSGSGGTGALAAVYVGTALLVAFGVAWLQSLLLTVLGVVMVIGRLPGSIAAIVAGLELLWGAWWLLSFDALGWTAGLALLGAYELALGIFGLHRLFSRPTATTTPAAPPNANHGGAAVAVATATAAGFRGPANASATDGVRPSALGRFARDRQQGPSLSPHVLVLALILGGAVTVAVLSTGVVLLGNSPRVMASNRSHRGRPTGAGHDKSTSACRRAQGLDDYCAPIRGMSFTEDSRDLVTLSSESRSELVRWDLTTKTPRWRADFEPSGTGRAAVALSPQGRRIVVYWNSEGRLLDADSGARIADLLGCLPPDTTARVAPFLGATFSRDGRWLAVAGKGICIHDANSGKQLRHIPSHCPFAAVDCYLGPSESQIWSHCRDQITVWNPHTGEQVKTVRLERFCDNCPRDRGLSQFHALTRDGSRFLAIHKPTAGVTAWWWNAETGAFLAHVALPDVDRKDRIVALLPDDRSLLVTRRTRYGARVIDARNGRQVGEFATSLKREPALAVSSDGRMAATGRPGVAGHPPLETVEIWLPGGGWPGASPR